MHLGLQVGLQWGAGGVEIAAQISVLAGIWISDFSTGSREHANRYTTAMHASLIKLLISDIYKRLGLDLLQSAYAG